MQQDVRIFQNTFLTEHQKQLFKIQRLRTITLDTSDQYSSELSDNSLKKSGSHKTRRRAKRIKKTLSRFQGKSLTDTDIKLLLGVIHSNPAKKAIL